MLACCRRVSSSYQNRANGCMCQPQLFQAARFRRRTCKEYSRISPKKYHARISIMATTAVLRAIVVDKVQSSRVGGSAVSCSISANDNGSASASSSQTIKQEDGLERRASQASETSTQQKDDEEILNAVGILAPGPDRFNEHKGKPKTKEYQSI